MADKVTWFELPAIDTTRAGKFYGEVFDWNMSDMGGGSLMAITTPSNEQGEPSEPGAINGDISPMTATFNRAHVVITVEDINAKIEKVKKAGGLVVQPAAEVPEMKMIWAIVRDTEGNDIGILQNL